MRTHFDKQLDKLNDELIEMGSMIEKAIEHTIKALVTQDIDLANYVIESDEQVNRQERDIESLCLKLLLQQQPVARDLRSVSSALKMISDMERIGDQSLDIIEIVEYVKKCDRESKQYIEEMSNAAGKMVSDSVEAFVRKDEQLAKDVIASDDKVDLLFDIMKKRLIETISKEQANGEMYIDLIMIAKYYERIGDHATNIAEWVLYYLTGTKVSGNKDS